MPERLRASPAAFELITTLLLRKKKKMPLNEKKKNKIDKKESKTKRASASWEYINERNGEICLWSEIHDKFQFIKDNYRCITMIIYSKQK